MHHRRPPMEMAFMAMSDQNSDIGKLQPLNLYGWSKHKFDLLAKKRAWDKNIAGLKYFNVFWPLTKNTRDLCDLLSVKRTNKFAKREK